VRRRAVTSVTRNLMCPDKATAERVVNEVFESCFKDTRPFDEVHDLIYSLGPQSIFVFTDILIYESQLMLSFIVISQRSVILIELILSKKTVDSR
jgi:hypothetical protein